METQKTTTIVSGIVTDESIEALDSAVSVLKKEYGEYKLTAAMRQQLAMELGEDPEIIDKWQYVADILDHIDAVELAKKHPDVVGKVSKSIISIVGFFCPAVQVANIVPEEFAAKLVEFAGILTPEHLINLLAKSQVAKNKRKRELLAEQPTLRTLETTPNNSKESKPKKAFSSLFTKKKAPPAVSNDDILETISKLSSLKDNGIITQEEFDTKKEELLKRL